MKPFGTGAVRSKQDPRTIELPAMAGEPLTEGGVVYSPEDIEHQHKVGICTAISLTQNRAKANGRKYSADFQYLLQKKYYDGGWWEGSSIFHALKTGKAFGFLPEELWTHTTENDRYLSYSAYSAKLQAIPEAEIERLKGLCIDKLPGYAAVNVNDPQAIAKAIDESDAGILCMYGVSSNWWTPSWLPKDINPLRWGIPTSNHAIIMNRFYLGGEMQKLTNTWGTDWCDKGCADIKYSTYRMTEAWAILKEAPVIPQYKFNHNLWFGRRDIDNIELQRRLGVSPTDLNFGPKTLAAVIRYQKAHGITPAYGFCGPITRASLNSNPN